MEYILIWFGCGVLSAIVASGKNRSALAWFVLGFLFGPFGFIASLVVQTVTLESKEQPKTPSTEPRHSQNLSADAWKESDPAYKPCPYCAELIRAEAKICRYCDRNVQAPIDDRSLDEKLRDAIDAEDLVEIKDLMAQGVNPERLFKGISHINYADLHGKNSALAILNR